MLGVDDNLNLNYVIKKYNNLRIILEMKRGRYYNNSKSIAKLILKYISID